MLKKLIAPYFAVAAVFVPVALYANRDEKDVPLKYIAPVQMALTWPLSVVTICLSRNARRPVEAD